MPYSTHNWLRILLMLQCCSPYLSTLSLSSTLATSHYKKSQLFIVISLTEQGLLIFQGAVPRPSVLQIWHCQSSHWPNLLSSHQADISLNINDISYMWQLFNRQRDRPKHFFRNATDWKTTAPMFCFFPSLFWGLNHLCTGFYFRRHFTSQPLL